MLAAPVAAAHLASARLLTPRTLWPFWWATLALPLAQRPLREEARGDGGDEAGLAFVAWTWVPAAMAVLHLWAVGYVHTVEFRPAFPVPLLLGLALTARPGQAVRKVALPALALVLSLGQRAVLGFSLPGPDGPLVSPLRLTVLAVVATWTWLAWRDRDRGLAVLAGCLALAAGLGSLPSSAWHALGRVLLFVDAHRPRGAFGWGVLAVSAAFVLLGAGARRSLAESRDSMRR